MGSERILTSNEDVYGIFRVLDIKPNTHCSEMNHEYLGLYVRSEMYKADYDYYSEKLELKLAEVFPEGSKLSEYNEVITYYAKDEVIEYERKEKYFVFFVNLLDRDWWIKENDFRGCIKEDDPTFAKLYEKCIKYYEAQNQDTLLMPSITLKLLAGAFYKRSNPDKRCSLIFSLRANFLAEVSRRKNYNG